MGVFQHISSKPVKNYCAQNARMRTFSAETRVRQLE
jgi:hypothetical protein